MNWNKMKGNSSWQCLNELEPKFLRWTKWKRREKRRRKRRKKNVKIVRWNAFRTRIHPNQTNKQFSSAVKAVMESNNITKTPQKHRNFFNFTSERWDEEKKTEIFKNKNHIMCLFRVCICTPFTGYTKSNHKEIFKSDSKILFYFIFLCMLLFFLLEFSNDFPFPSAINETIPLTGLMLAWCDILFVLFVGFFFAILFIIFCIFFYYFHFTLFK